MLLCYLRNVAVLPVHKGGEGGGGGRQVTELSGGGKLALIIVNKATKKLFPVKCHDRQLSSECVGGCFRWYCCSLLWQSPWTQDAHPTTTEAPMMAGRGRGGDS